MDLQFRILKYLKRVGSASFETLIKIYGSKRGAEIVEAIKELYDGGYIGIAYDDYSETISYIPTQETRQ